ncbi:PASTA domain-containing protein [Saccharospirillum impatiens]|uniref:PASTA domain-containing protein n=1 Tax=Saccharospirillum impatiens TaxID=169438 RepID=UPI00040D59A0|nr:PASTA domain-containing protein [Saccharospirillum impatiens]
MKNLRSLVQDVVASPLGDVIASVGEGVASAQQALDEGSLAAVLDLYAESDDAKMKLLQDIGYRPTFYALPDTTGEVRVTLRLGQGAAGASSATAVKKTTVPSVRATLGRQGLNTSRKLYASPVDAGYTNQYGFSADVSAKLTFRIVPIPPPDGVDELRLVPNVVQDAEGNRRSLAIARSALEQLGLTAIVASGDTEVDENRLVASQDPAADSIARAGDEVILTLEE